MKRKKEKEDVDFRWDLINIVCNFPFIKSMILLSIFHLESYLKLLIKFFL